MLYKGARLNLMRTQSFPGSVANGLYVRLLDSTILAAFDPDLFHLGGKIYIMESDTGMLDPGFIG